MINVKEATAQESEFIIQAQVSMAMESEGLKLDLETVRKGVAAVFKNPHLGTYYIASEGSQPVGCLLLIPEWSDWRNGMVMWIHSVYVPPAHRRKGVFRAMYEHLKQKTMKDEGLRGLRLYVDHSNERAQKVYQSLGMNSDHYALYEWMKTF